MIRFFQLALRLRHGETPVADELFRQETTLTRFVLAEKVAELKKWAGKSPNILPGRCFLEWCLSETHFRQLGLARILSIPNKESA